MRPVLGRDLRDYFLKRPTTCAVCGRTSPNLRADGCCDGCECCEEAYAAIRVAMVASGDDFDADLS